MDKEKTQIAKKLTKRCLPSRVNNEMQNKTPMACYFTAITLARNFKWTKLSTGQDKVKADLPTVLEVLNCKTTLKSNKATSHTCEDVYHPP